MSKQVRYAFNITDDTHGRLKSLSKLNYLTIGQVLDVLLDNLSEAQHAALSAHRDKVVADRAAAAAIKKRVAKLTPEQLQYLESLGK